MARLPRNLVAGLAQHVIQRGNNRQAVFFADGDYRFYVQNPQLQGVRAIGYLIRLELRIGAQLAANVPQIVLFDRGSDNDIRMLRDRLPHKSSCNTYSC
jgi:hypothetical protein